MDRIYTINDEAYQFYFKQWASKHGYYFKSEQNWFNTRQFEMLGSKKINLDLVLDLPSAKFDRLPYMDTFKFMDYDGKLYNFQPKGKEYYTLTDTGGRKNGYDHLVTDYITGVLRYRGDAIRLRYLEVEGGVRAHTHPDSCYYSEIMDTYILRDHSIQHPVLRDYIFNDDFKEHNNEERIQERIKYVEEREIQRKKEIEERETRRARQREEMNVRSETGGYETGRLYGEIDDYTDIMNQMRGLRNRYSLDQLYSAVTEYLDLHRHGYRGTLLHLLEDRAAALLHDIGVRNEQPRIRRERRPVRLEEVTEEPTPVVDTPLSEIEVLQDPVDEPRITATQLFDRYYDTSSFRTTDTTDVRFIPTDSDVNMFRTYYNPSGIMGDIENDTTRETQTEEGAE
jgi:hypothetical protein